VAYQCESSVRKMVQIFEHPAGYGILGMFKIESQW